MTVSNRPLSTILNESSPGKLPSALQYLRVGRALSGIPRAVRSNALVANELVLDNDKKAAAILFAYARAGGATGELAPVVGVPGAGQVAIGPTGNILCAAADAVTDLEVVYVSHEGELVTETGAQVVGSAFTPAFGRSVAILIAATVLTGVAPGAMAVTARASVPALGDAAADDVGLVQFNAGNVVAGTATVTYIAFPGIGSAEVASAEKLDDLLDF
jgi:hypothetical protein